MRATCPLCMVVAKKESTCATIQLLTAYTSPAPKLLTMQLCGAQAVPRSALTCLTCLHIDIVKDDCYINDSCFYRNSIGIDVFL